jgi:acyl CoA:acetate/3-ketoacid CoA transferase alpha subunit
LTHSHASRTSKLHASALAGLAFDGATIIVGGVGLGKLRETRRIKTIISSYAGENRMFAQPYRTGGGDKASGRR